jgi:hypothetical protein
MIIKRITEATACLLILCLSFSIGYVMFEPGMTEAAQAIDSVIVTLNVNTEISITSPADTAMSTYLGVTNNTAVGTTTWNVKTNNAVGYTLGVAASTNPAMQSGSNYIDDYSTTSMPSVWSVSSGNAKFGFSAFGTDALTRFSAGATTGFCNGNATSTASTTLKYYGFYTVATTTATRTSTTTPSGVDTTICYMVEQNGTYVPSGTYTATITATATTL